METRLQTVATGTPGRRAARGRVRMRPIARTDTGGLVALHERLSPRTRRCRFLTTHPSASAGQIAALTEVDGRDRVALVGMADDRVVGVARYERCADGDEASMSLVVEDALQGAEAGEDVEFQMIERLAATARRHGIRRFVLMVDPIDRDLIERLDDSPFAVSRHYHSGTVTITIHLDGWT